jgi:N-acetylglucosaminyl-diphospho-decaprenol L-rhamnosyltransferase
MTRLDPAAAAATVASRRAARPGAEARRLANVSACIVNWNCRELLRRCLAALSAAGQRVRIEIIVVDNGSSDGAADMVAAEFPHVRLIRNPDNAGFARANNQAARAAGGDYLLFLNNDTECAPAAVETLVGYLDDNPDALLIGPRLRGADGRPQIAHRRKPTVATFLHRTWLARWSGLFRSHYRQYRRQTLAAQTPHDVEVLIGAALMLRRQDFWDLGGWDEDFSFGGEDLEMCARAWQKGRVVYCPQAEVIHQGSVSTNENIAFATPRIAAGFVRYFRKTGATPRELFLYKLLVTLDAPFQLIARSVQALLRLITGRPRQAAKSWTAAKGTAAFLWRGLGAFWRA